VFLSILTAGCVEAVGMLLVCSLAHKLPVAILIHGALDDPVVQVSDLLCQLLHASEGGIVPTHIEKAHLLREQAVREGKPGINWAH